jgi:ATP-dependent Clp protease ATP-binding subunit ClpC
MLRPSEAQPPAAPPKRQAAESIPQAPIVPEERPPRFDPAIYRRFTDRARKVMQLSHHEAQRFNHEFIGTEHLLLALIKEGSGVAADVLRSLELDLRDLRGAVEKWSPPGRDMVTNPKLPQTPRAKKVIVQAIAEADALGHEQVDTAHLLLALMTEPEALAAQILSHLGHSAEDIRELTLRRLSAETPPT